MYRQASKYEQVTINLGQALADTENKKKSLLPRTPSSLPRDKDLAKATKALAHAKEENAQLRLKLKQSKVHVGSLSSTFAKSQWENMEATKPLEKIHAQALEPTRSGAYNFSFGRKR